MFTPCYQCLRLLTCVYLCLLVFNCLQLHTHVYLCVTLFTCACLPSLLMCTHLPLVTLFFYQCLPLFTRLYLCLPLFTYVYPCLLVFTYAYTRLPMLTHVYSCLPMFTLFYLKQKPFGKKMRYRIAKKVTETRA